MIISKKTVYVKWGLCKNRSKINLKSHFKPLSDSDIYELKLLICFLIVKGTRSVLVFYALLLFAKVRFWLVRGHYVFYLL